MDIAIRVSIRGDQGDGVSHGECGNDRDQRPHAAKGDHQAKQKQQMVAALQDVVEAHDDEASGRMKPAGIQVHQARIAFELQGAGDAARGQKLDRRDLV